MNLRIWFILLIMILTCVGTKSLAAQKCSGAIMSLGMSPKQTGPFPVVFYINQKLSYEYHKEIRSAASIWNDVLGFEAIRIHHEIDHSNYRNPEDSRNVIYISYGNGEMKKQESAVTFSKQRYTSLDDTDIVLNRDASEFSPEQEAGKMHIISVMVHEFGHALGMGHVDRASSVMYGGLYPGQYKVDLDRQDVKNVRCIYKGVRNGSK